MADAPVWKGDAYGEPATLVDPASNRGGVPVAVGDWMLLFIMFSSSGDLQTIDVPEGWMQIRDQLPVDIVGGTFSVGIYVKKREAGETTYAMTADATGQASVWSMHWISGAADFDQWIIGSYGLRSASGGTTLVNIPSVITTKPNSTVFAWAAERTTADETYTQLTLNNGMTVVGGHELSATNPMTRMGYKVLAAPGSSGTTTFTAPNTHAYNGIGLHIVIPPPEPPAGLIVARWDGSQVVAAKAYLMGPQGLTTPALVTRIDRGYESAQDFVDSTDETMIAYRGGSADWQEESLHAYTQAAVRGIRAFEVSVARTSDGVWFGLHDSTLNRTSPTAPAAWNPSAHTWAEVQAFNIDVTGQTEDQPPEPYMRLHELIAAYGGSHVIAIDIRSWTSQSASLLTLMNSYPAATRQRLLVKASASNTAFAASAHAAGFLTFGLYSATDSAIFASTQASWDVLAMEYTADQATWDSIKSYGKNVLAHIIATESDADVARSKGADGLRVSGVRAVKGW